MILFCISSFQTEFFKIIVFFIKKLLRVYKSIKWRSKFIDKVNNI